MEESTQPAELLDARMAAWQRSVQSAGCTITVTPPHRSRSATPSKTCGDFDLHVRVSGDDLAAASGKLSEYLRLLHAASARPARLRSYDWLQQLMWPNVCIRPKCQCCHDGDRSVSLRLSCATSGSAPLPQVISYALCGWTEDSASAEYHQLIAAVRGDSAGATPADPLRLTVVVMAATYQLSEAEVSGFIGSTGILVECLADHSSDWFQVEALAASFLLATNTIQSKVLGMLTASKLPLVLREVSPTRQPSDTTMNEWLFGRRSSRKASSPPSVVDLHLPILGAPSARVFSEFCSWLASNNSLKRLSVGIPTILSTSTPQAWEELGFALFSPSSELKLNRLELDIRGITESNIDSMVSGSRDDSHIEERRVHLEAKHDAFKLTTSGLPTALQLKFIKHFCHVARRVILDVFGGEYRQVLAAVFESSPLLEELEVTFWGAQMNEGSASENAATTPNVPVSTVPKLRCLTLYAVTSNVGVAAIVETIALTGSTLSSLTIGGWTASAGLGESILHSCPVLQTLIVSTVEGGFWERLSDGYTSGRCKISEVSIGGSTRQPSPWVFDLAQTLRNPTLPLTRTLQRLCFNAEYVSSQLSVVGGQLLEMLDSNPFLVELELPFCDQQRDAARAKNGKVVANVSYPLSPRHQMALLSCASTIAKGAVPREIWRLVLEFGARPARRSVIMEM